MKYSDLHYERISVEEQDKLLNERLERFNDATSVEEQIAVINQCQGAVAILERVAADITLEKTDKKMCEKVTTNYSFDKKE